MQNHSLALLTAFPGIVTTFPMVLNLLGK